MTLNQRYGKSGPLPHLIKGERNMHDVYCVDSARQNRYDRSLELVCIIWILSMGSLDSNSDSKCLNDGFFIPASL